MLTRQGEDDAHSMRAAVIDEWDTRAPARKPRAIELDGRDSARYTARVFDRSYRAE